MFYEYIEQWAPSIYIYIYILENVVRDIRLAIMILNILISALKKPFLTYSKNHLFSLSCKHL